MLKNNKGITLIALVITIIVLLILAGVSIGLVTGNNGILNQASRASAETRIAEAKEMAGLDVSSLVADYYEQRYVKNNTTVKSKDVDEYIKANLKSKDGYYTYASNEITLTPVKQDGTQVTATINSDGSLDWSDITGDEEEP